MKTDRSSHGTSERKVSFAGAARSRRDFLKRSITGLSALALSGCGGFGRATTEPVEGLYARAKGEGQLNLYGGGPAGPYRRWANEFEAAFPGITVNVTATFSNILAPRIDAQRAAGKLEADLAIFQTLQDYARWKRKNALLEFRPEGFDQIPDVFKDPDGTSVGVGISGLSYAYNTTLVPRADVPKQAGDFLQPKFREGIITTYPHDDDVTLYLYHTIVEKYGWQFMDGLMANKPKFVRGHLGVAQEIAAGRARVTFDAILGATLNLRRGGAPEDIFISEVDPLPIWPQTAGIFRGAPHPNAAKLYVTWYLAKEQQSRIGTWSPRKDVPPPAELRPLFDYPLANGFRQFITDEAQVADLRKRFEKYIGPVTGQPVV